ncbi:MAG: MarR family transcriptional regulator [Myxococcales bacterium]|nr:MAG: MarR family transcriptional regulator [Myxococcales bacterium]
MQPSTDELLFAATRALRQRFRAGLADIEITPAQTRALRTIVGTPSLRLSGVASALGIAPRSATEVVDALESRGWVRRAPDPDDRRAVVVLPTDAGRELADRLAVVRRQVADEMLADFSDSDRRQLDRLLARLATS